MQDSLLDQLNGGLGGLGKGNASDAESQTEAARRGKNRGGKGCLVRQIGGFSRSFGTQHACTKQARYGTRAVIKTGRMGLLGCSELVRLQKLFSVCGANVSIDEGLECCNPPNIRPTLLKLFMQQDLCTPLKISKSRISRQTRVEPPNLVKVRKLRNATAVQVSQKLPENSPVAPGYGQNGFFLSVGALTDRTGPQPTKWPLAPPRAPVSRTPGTHGTPNSVHWVRIQHAN